MIMDRIGQLIPLNSRIYVNLHSSWARVLGWKCEADCWVWQPKAVDIDDCRQSFLLLRSPMWDSAISCQAYRFEDQLAESLQFDQESCCSASREWIRLDWKQEKEAWQPIAPNQGLCWKETALAQCCYKLMRLPLYLAEVLCRGAAAAVIVFDLTNEESFKKAQSWVKELQKMGNPNMIMSLAGNKADLADQRAVSSEDAKVCGPPT